MAAARSASRSSRAFSPPKRTSPEVRFFSDFSQILCEFSGGGGGGWWMYSVVLLYFCVTVIFCGCRCFVMCIRIFGGVCSAVCKRNYTEGVFFKLDICLLSYHGGV